MSDRDAFRANREAGLRARHETRLARAQGCKCTYPDDAGCPVHGDEATLALIADETREARAIRKQVAEEIAEAIEEASADIYYGDRHALHEAVEIARQIGAQE